MDIGYINQAHLQLYDINIQILQALGILKATLCPLVGRMTILSLIKG